MCEAYDEVRAMSDDYETRTANRTVAWCAAFLLFVVGPLATQTFRINWLNNRIDVLERWQAATAKALNSIAEIETTCPACKLRAESTCRRADKAALHMGRCQYGATRLINPRNLSQQFPADDPRGEDEIE